MVAKNDAIDFSLVLASSVHDMKNSVGMLLASLESVIEDTPPTNEKQAKRFSSLQYEASRINSELVQLLTIYRMQNRMLPVCIDEHYLIDIIEDQVARNHMLMSTKGVSVTIDCDTDLPWYFDQDLVGSVIHNILVNCVRYTKSAVLVGAKVEQDMLCITIADDGPGYPEDMLNQNMESFTEFKGATGGTHLGLYFAEKIATSHTQNERHGYTELANGPPLGGGVFKLYIP